MSLLKLTDGEISADILHQLEEIRKSITAPAWIGPYVGGNTQSLVTRFLECPFRFYLYAILGIEENEELHPNLIWGDILHKGLEHYLHPNCTHQTAVDHMKAYAAEKYPRAPSTYDHSTSQMLKLYNRSFVESNGLVDHLETEKEFVIEDVVNGETVVYRGKADVYNKPCRFGGEHKCKGKIDPPQSRAESPVDTQVLLYSHALNIRHWVYDIIRIPEAQFMVPPKRTGETAQIYIQRLFHSQVGQEYPISRHPYAWLNQFSFDVTKPQIDTFLEYTWRPLTRKMIAWWNHVTHPSFSLLDPNCYNENFYITPIRHFDPSNTERFKCKYWSLLTGNTEVDSLVPVTGFYNELETA